jgi:hypothetical protein
MTLYCCYVSLPVKEKVRLGVFDEDCFIPMPKAFCIDRWSVLLSYQVP